MNKEFIKKLHKKHIETNDFYPATSSISKLTTRIILTLFPEQAKKRFHTIEDCEKNLRLLEDDLKNILSSMEDKLPYSSVNITEEFMKELPFVYEYLNEDIQAILNGDPAAQNEYEIIRTYPGFYAIAFYRIAHILHKLNVPLLPRVITEFAHSKTGIDIHPGARISPSFFIDHGTGIVIGETAIIGKNVKIYQGVTLGALSVSKNLAATKRHPTIEENVVIYAGATILGGETVIGNNSIIGGNVWITKSVEKNSVIYYKAQIKVNKNIGTT